MEKSGEIVLAIGEPIKIPTSFGELNVSHLRMNLQEGILVTGQKPFAFPVPVRVQSSCLFSESLHSIDCDCSAQLHASLKIIVSEGGIVIYLYEEGRGAGLELKMKAIRAQQEFGYHTAAAFGHLELESDLRDHAMAARVIIAVIGREREVSLLTNNPYKVKALEETGIKVAQSRPLIFQRNDIVSRYLDEKVHNLGHRLNHD